MLMIVEDNIAVQQCYVVHMNRRFMVRNEHYIFVRSLDDVKDAVKTYGTMITNVIVDHELVGPKTGADVLRYLWNIWPNHEFNSVRVSNLAEFGYPYGIKWFAKQNLGRALDHLLGPLVRIETTSPFGM